MQIDFLIGIIMIRFVMNTNFIPNALGKSVVYVISCLVV